MSAIIDQMDEPNNREADDRKPRTEDDNSDPISESVGGSYYYDDSTGYEVYEGDDESADDEPNRNRDEDKLTTEDTEKNEKQPQMNADSRR